MKRTSFWGIAALLWGFGAALPSVIAADTTAASGSLVVGGDRIDLRYAYALRRTEEFGNDKELLLVVTDKPITESDLRAKYFSIMIPGSKLGVRGVELIMDSSMATGRATTASAIVAPGRANAGKVNRAGFLAPPMNTNGMAPLSLLVKLANGEKGKLAGQVQMGEPDFYRGSAGKAVPYRLDARFETTIVDVK